MRVAVSVTARCTTSSVLRKSHKTPPSSAAAGHIPTRCAPDDIFLLLKVRCSCCIKRTGPLTAPAAPTLTHESSIKVTNCCAPAAKVIPSLARIVRSLSQATDALGMDAFIALSEPEPAAAEYGASSWSVPEDAPVDYQHQSAEACTGGNPLMQLCVVA